MPDEDSQDVLDTSAARGEDELQRLHGRVDTEASRLWALHGERLVCRRGCSMCCVDDITVVVHPQSIVHSMVEFWDGATIAQASPPDMRLPIALGLSWPDRLPDAAAGCDWSTATQWTFEPLDNDTFGAVELARRAGHAAGTAPAVFNAANESCVDAFCAGTALGGGGILTSQKGV